MKLPRRKFELVLMSLLASTTSFADDLTVPNTFTAGTPARAAEVNDNFTAVEASVDDNAADIAVNTVAVQANTDAIAGVSTGIQVYSATGQAIGTLISYDAQGYITTLSKEGYIFRPQSVGRVTSAEADQNYLTGVGIRYSGPSCTGTAMVSYGDFSISQGMVLRGTGPTPIPVYYSPRGNVRLPDSTPYQSKHTKDAATGQPVCLPEIGVFSEGYVLLPNDPAITGVSDTPPAQPLSIGFPN